MESLLDLPHITKSLLSAEDLAILPGGLEGCHVARSSEVLDRGCWTCTCLEGRVLFARIAEKRDVRLYTSGGKFSATNVCYMSGAFTQRIFE